MCIHHPHHMHITAHHHLHKDQDQQAKLDVIMILLKYMVLLLMVVQQNFVEQVLVASNQQFSKLLVFYFNVPIKACENCGGYSQILHRQNIRQFKSQFQLFSCQKLQIHTHNKYIKEILLTIYNIFSYKFLSQFQNENKSHIVSEGQLQQLNLNIKNLMEQKEQELSRKNRQLEERKRQIEEELKKLSSNQEEQDIQHTYEQHQYEEEQEQKPEKPEQQDIIGQLQAVKKATEERNQNKLKQLKKTFENNKNQIEKNNQKLEKLENNIQLAEAAVKMKNELKRDLEGKGKKISDQSKKWINQIAKLNDKHDQLKKNVATLTKDEDSLRNQYSNLQKKLVQLNKEKVSYESQYKNLNGKLQQLKVEIEGGKQVIKEKQIVNKQQSLKDQKNKQKMQMNQKRLERQKNELIKAYKKLNQYISLLRKTNTHLQTANSLNFTLKEYLQAIDKTDIIPA